MILKKELLIFGSGGALGKGVTNVLSRKDFNKIYLFDFKFDSEKTTNQLSQIIIEDLSDEGNVIKAFKSIKTDRSTFYFLYSTIGGYFGGKPARETGVEDFDRMININLKANFLIVKHFTNLVRNASGGSVCLTSAYVGSHPEANKAVYGASKAALSHLVRTLSEEGNKIRLSVNAIAPYVIDTQENRKWMNDTDIEQAMKTEEIGEFISSIFEKFNFISGNIFELKHRFNL